MNFRSNMDVLSSKNLGGTIFMAVPRSANNTVRTCFGEDLVKIRPTPAVAEQSRQKKKKQNGY